MKHANAATLDYDQLAEEILAPEDVHDRARVSAATATHGLFLVLALVLVHGFILYLFLGTATWPVIPLLLHIIVSAVVAGIAYAQYKQGMDAQHLALLAIVSATTGIFGVVGALIGFISSGVFRFRAHHFNEWYETIFPTDAISMPQQIYDRIREGLDENPQAYNVMPFADVMRLGSENQKRRALAKMTSRFSPRFAEAFRIALSDRHNGIRVQAATAIAKVEREFTRSLSRLEQARAQEPNNPLLTLALAKFYDDYAFTGILDGELERLNRERAIRSYQAYLERDPNANEVWIAIGRLKFRNREWADAADWFRHALDRGIQSNSMLLWYFESLFHVRQYRELRRAMLEFGRGIPRNEDFPTAMREAVSLWMQVA